MFYKALFGLIKTSNKFPQLMSLMSALTVAEDNDLKMKK